MVPVAVVQGAPNEGSAKEVLTAPGRGDVAVGGPAVNVLVALGLNATLGLTRADRTVALLVARFAVPWGRGVRRVSVA